MKAKIYKPSKTAMQSGRSKFNKWVLKFDNNRNQKKDSLMGWNGGSNTNSQIELKFDTKIVLPNLKADALFELLLLWR